MSDHIVRRRRFFAVFWCLKRFSLIFGVKRVAFTDPASNATLVRRKAEEAAPMLQLLSRWAVTAVPVARMQRHRLLLRRPRQSTQQLAAAAGAKLRRRRRVR